ncbi:hypothetical protein ACW5XF_02340 [Aeromonas lusitana]|uniref:Uncharacterized protein n=1 Tax=Aeromonas lusitana TaxID=931529 RepID=A0A2M8H8J4_9GAMM|nr:hypothetical protein [Aeromonas lusitana]PJC92882.1 hypothetical protein CUC44_12415 [Aeromonas lusitana]
MNTRPAICLICSLGGVACPLLAAQDPLALLSDQFAPEMADGELANLRGRYVSPQGISYFGIEFISTLATAQAQQTAAMNLALSVVQNQPKLDIRIQDEVKSTVASLQSAAIQGSGLVQVVQLEGSGNSSVNQAGVVVTPPAVSGQSVVPGNYESQGSLGTANYRVSGNYAGLQLNSSDGRVQLEQSLRGADFSRGLLQLNRVRGDGFQTLNQTRIWFSH